MQFQEFGATGLWQFDKDCKIMDSLVNSLVDERRDPIKSSYAAAHYLSDLYKLYDWNLVIAAYNCGEDKISKAMHRSKQTDYYWQIYPYLPEGDKGICSCYICCQLHHELLLRSQYMSYDFRTSCKTDTILVNKDINFEQISHVLGIDID